MNYAQIRRGVKQPKNIPTAGNVARVIFDEHAAPSQAVRTECIEETLALNAAGSANMTTQLPAGSRVKFVSIYLETGMTLTTATKLAVGTAGTPSAFYLSGTTMTSGTNDAQPTADTNARVSTATTVKLATTDNSGNATGSGTGTVKVLVVYEYLQLPNA